MKQGEPHFFGLLMSNCSSTIFFNVKILNLFKSLVLGDFCHHFSGEKEVLPHYCDVAMKV